MAVSLLPTTVFGRPLRGGVSGNSIDGEEESRSVLPPSYEKFSPEGLC